MTRRARASRLAALAAVLALLVLERLQDESDESARPAPVPAAAAPASPPEPSATSTEPEPRAAPARPRSARRRARPPPAPAEQPAVSLDDLLRIPVEGPQSPAPLDLAPKAAAGEPAAPGKAQRVRIDFSSREPLGEAPVPRAWRQSEAGVSVPLDEAERLRVRGGVRVDQRGEKEAAREVETTPSFGLEFRF